MGKLGCRVTRWPARFSTYGVKIKWLYTVYVEAGDVVSLVSVEDGPSFTFHTDVSTISSNNFSANIHYYGYIYILMCVCLCFFLLVWAMEMAVCSWTLLAMASHQMMFKLSNADHCWL